MKLEGKSLLIGIILGVIGMFLLGAGGNTSNDWGVSVAGDGYVVTKEGVGRYCIIHPQLGVANYVKIDPSKFNRE